jgi:hypothetical protein
MTKPQFSSARQPIITDPTGLATLFFLMGTPHIYGVLRQHSKRNMAGSIQSAVLKIFGPVLLMAALTETIDLFLL